MPTEFGEGLIAVGLAIEKLQAAKDEPGVEVRALQVAKQLAERRVDESRAEVRALREALALQMFDLHEHSTRPCTTCAQSRKALGLDTSTSEGMLGCGYSMVENRIAWRALAPEPSEPRS